MSRLVAKVLGVHQSIYIASKGYLGHHVPGMAPNLLLTSIGAKTGAQRVNSLTYAKDGDNLVIVASNGGARRNPAWYHNLKAHPEVQVQLGRQRRRVRATALLPGDTDYERLWKLADTNNSGHYSAYQRATSRPIPLVVLAAA
ncbi:MULTISPECIES: nitroreductase family deazaflavin-dependent oxidoreductase [Mycobacteroides]|jgi:deazaflavin-dependent oxidoreductase (nitroreductase family)|uniref:Nitroreductase n=1 Tax=Mycobacteroides chelonae TaxID=1774 RepID=A0A1S1LX17_MYCCH|nr:MULTISPECIES: nitroreductase family deazaflavin-dependent oxidoreductase [Mycobacteroides]PKQ56147.1 nitroreductase [Mycobacterium sp. MHSD3]SKM04343.1 nitroreductase [Mycobacteroides abscessus subsp. bolletii]KRQ22285.1 nitroreductase [Mycobacteroides sp. H003]KRQ25080.1 nitroreductase [Mycobacteroides sp. H072]KRQ27706.1 nitroreductase [Mycobacteroides sp. H092]